tara:strand:+ start:2687 stop:3730 length:1044 start_codon:yes stop_codon:yes gene_type:complete
METYKILDRFELLYPTDERFSDLRRAYIDKDLHSIFRLSNVDDEYRKAILEKNVYSIFRLCENATVQGDIEDLKKAIIDQNLYSIFRLIPDDYEDLKKAVCNENRNSIYKLLELDSIRKIVELDNPYALYDTLIEYTDSQFAHALKFMFLEGVEFDEDCLSRGQLRSKIWLVNELKKISVDLGVVFLCAGWYGTLAVMLFESGMSIEKIRSFDIDPSTEKVAEMFNKKWISGWKFKPVVQDIHDIDFEEHNYIVLKKDGDFERLWDIPNTIINTSCEHIDNFETWYEKIPSGKLVVLQCNDYDEIEEHVNTHENIESFAQQTPMETELYSGEIDLGKYKRFMRIGFK